jgi:hypothetical protein
MFSDLPSPASLVSRATTSVGECTVLTVPLMMRQLTHAANRWYSSSNIVTKVGSQWYLTGLAQRYRINAPCLRISARNIRKNLSFGPSSTSMPN